MSIIQYLWLAGTFAFGGLVLTPSAHPHIPPFSLVVAVPLAPGEMCEGPCIYIAKANLAGFTVNLPVVHYFHYWNGIWWETYNARAVMGVSPLETLYNYVRALVDPLYISAPTANRPIARVAFWVPGPLILLSWYFAARTVLYYRGRKVW